MPVKLENLRWFHIPKPFYGSRILSAALVYQIFCHTKTKFHTPYACVRMCAPPLLGPRPLQNDGIDDSLEYLQNQARLMRLGGKRRGTSGPIEPRTKFPSLHFPPSRGLCSFNLTQTTSFSSPQTSATYLPPYDDILLSTNKKCVTISLTTYLILCRLVYIGILRKYVKKNALARRRGDSADAQQINQGWLHGTLTSRGCHRPAESLARGMSTYEREIFLAEATPLLSLLSWRRGYRRFCPSSSGMGPRAKGFFCHRLEREPLFHLSLSLISLLFPLGIVI